MPVPWGALRLPRCPPHRQTRERPAGWSSGPRARHPPRPLTAARRTGPPRCSPRPSAGPGPGRSLGTTGQAASTPAPRAGPPSPGRPATPPVPRGRMATAGSGQARWCRRSSRAASTQPTVPSPPHTSTRKQGTRENTWNLAAGRQGMSATATDQWGAATPGQGGAHEGPAPRLQVCSPRQRPPVGQLKDLVGVKQLPETAEQVAALESSTPGVHKHEQGAAVWGQLRVLTDAGCVRGCGTAPGGSRASPNPQPTPHACLGPAFLGREAMRPPPAVERTPTDHWPTGREGAWSPEPMAMAPPAMMCLQAPPPPGPRAHESRQEAHQDPPGSQEGHMGTKGHPTPHPSDR